MNEVSFGDEDIHPVEAKQVVDETKELLRRAIALLRFTLFAVVILALSAVAMSVQINQRNNTLEAINDAQDRQGVQIDKLGKIADDITTVTPEEQARSQATVAAVSDVPIILKILCQEFGEDVPECAP